MGCYIDLPGKRGHAEKLMALGAVEVGPPESIAEVPKGTVLICVVQNSVFDAAGVAYSEAEFQRMVGGMNGREHTWLLLDRPIALDLNPQIPNYEQEVHP